MVLVVGGSGSVTGTSPEVQTALSQSRHLRNVKEQTAECSEIVASVEVVTYLSYTCYSQINILIQLLAYCVYTASSITITASY